MPPEYLRQGKTPSRSREFCLRRMMAGCIMVVTVCLLSLLTSQPYASPSPVLLSVGRSIQSWHNNEYSEPRNTSAEIESVLAEQRKDLDLEFKGFKFPEGKYNISAKNLNDLVPELGGRPLRSIIVTTWRSGSTFLGDILNSLPGNYYHYEPLLDYGVIQVRGPPKSISAINNIKNLLNCNYTKMDSYLVYGQEHNWLFSHNTRLWNRCLSHPDLCWDAAFLNRFCALFPFQSMKVVRLRLSLMEELLEDPKLGIRVLLLVRDPRGTLQSRSHRDWCPASSDCSDPAILCSDLVADYSAAVRLHKKFPLNFKVMRYEDIAVDPYKGSVNILKFFGFDFHPNVKQFLDTHTKTDAGGVSSTYRNSKKAPFHWRLDLPYSKVLAIQKHCGPAMSAWGYVKAKGQGHQRTFNPVLPKFTLK